MEMDMKYARLNMAYYYLMWKIVIKEVFIDGCKIKEAKFNDKYLLEEDIWKIFNYFFSSKSVNNTSYKFAFLKSIIESVYEVNIDGEISLTEIFSRFIRIYWYLIVKHNLSQCTNSTRNGKTSINNIFDRYLSSYKELAFCDYDNIDNDIRRNIEKEVYDECNKYVVGALYGDTGGSIYSFSLKDNYIKFNPSIKFYSKVRYYIT